MGDTVTIAPGGKVDKLRATSTPGRWAHRQPHGDPSGLSPPRTIPADRVGFPQSFPPLHELQEVGLRNVFEDCPCVPAQLFEVVPLALQLAQSLGNRASAFVVDGAWGNTLEQLKDEFVRVLGRLSRGTRQ